MPDVDATKPMGSYFAVGTQGAQGVIGPTGVTGATGPAPVLTANKVMCTDGSGVITTCALATTTGMVDSVSSSTFHIDTCQGICAANSPTFVDITLSSMSANTLACTNNAGAMASCGFVTTTGVVESVSGSNLHIDTCQGLCAANSPTFVAVTLSGMSTNTLACTNNAGVMGSCALATTTGLVSSVSSSTLTLNTCQYLCQSATPTFASVILTSPSVNTLACINGTGAIVSCGFVTTTGIVESVSGNNLHIDSCQNLCVTATPTFVSVALTGPSINTVACINAAGTIVSCGFATTTGVVESVSGNNIHIDTCQGLCAANSPTFVSVTLTAPSINTMACISSAGTIVSCGAATTTGVIQSVSSNNFHIDTCQGLCSSNTPTFVSTTLTGPTINTLACINSAGTIVSCGFATTTGVVESVSSNNLHIDTCQNICPAATPSFASVTFTGSALTGYVATALDAYEVVATVVATTFVPTSGATSASITISGDIMGKRAFLSIPGGASFTCGVLFGSAMTATSVTALPVRYRPANAVEMATGCSVSGTTGGNTCSVTISTAGIIAVLWPGNIGNGVVVSWANDLQLTYRLTR
jgi:hypothetical protein